MGCFTRAATIKEKFVRHVLQLKIDFSSRYAFSGVTRILNQILTQLLKVSI